MTFSRGGAPNVIRGWILFFSLSLLIVLGETSPNENFHSRRHLSREKKSKTVKSKTPSLQTEAQRYPYLVSLLNPDYTRFCAGVLIDQTTVLTAAHCLVDKEQDILQTSPFVSVVGDPPQKAYIVENTIIHPLWISNNFNQDAGFDIAVLVLTKPVPDIPFPQLPSDGTKPGGFPSEVARVAPETGDGGNITEVLPLKVKDCQEVVEKMASDDLLCVTGQKRPCKGDSGAPLLQPSSKNITDHDFLFGIASFGPGCTEKVENPVDVFTEISKYKVWIRNVQKQPENCSYTESQILVDECLPLQDRLENERKTKCQIDTNSTKKTCRGVTFHKLSKKYGWSKLHLAVCTDQFVGCQEDFSDEDFSWGTGNEEVPPHIKSGSKPIHIAAAFAELNTFKAMVRYHHRYFDVKTDSGEIPLHYAAKFGNDKVVAWIVNKIKDIIDTQDDYGETALSYAAREGHEDTVEELIKRGAKIDMGEDLKRMCGVCAEKRSSCKKYKKLVKVCEEAAEKAKKGITVLGL